MGDLQKQIDDRIADATDQERHTWALEDFNRLYAQDIAAVEERGRKAGEQTGIAMAINWLRANGSHEAASLLHRAFMEDSDND